jgi:hypothetical protein
VFHAFGHHLFVERDVTLGIELEQLSRRSDARRRGYLGAVMDWFSSIVGPSGQDL